MDLPSNAPAPRLCHLVKWPDFDGYGFNLHAEKAKTGQFIGKVDDGSPAELAGLKESDRIIEVNGVNIANENHRQVVERIKAMVNETKLLVLDEEGDKYYKERKLVVKGTQANVIYKKTPPTQPSATDSSKPVVKDVKAVSAPIPVVDSPPVNGESPKVQQEDSTQEKKQKTPVQEKKVKTPPVQEKKVKTPPVQEKKVKTPPVQEKKVKTPTTPKKNTPEQNERRLSNENHHETEKNINGVHESPRAPVVETPPKKKADSPKPANAKAVAKTESSPKQAPKSQNGSSNGSTTTKSTVTSAVTNGSTTNGSTTNGSATNGTKNGTSQNGGVSPGTVGGGGDLNLNMSAAQMREMLANRKKRDPRNQSLDMREKYQIVQQM